MSVNHYSKTNFFEFSYMYVSVCLYECLYLLYVCMCNKCLMCISKAKLTCASLVLFHPFVTFIILCFTYCLANSF